MRQVGALAKLLHPSWDTVTRLDNFKLKEVPGGFKNLTPYAVSGQMAAILSFGPRFLMPRKVGAIDVLNDLGTLHVYLEEKYGNLDPTQVFIELFRKHRTELVTLLVDQSLSMVESCILAACNEVYEFFQVYKDVCIIQADKGNRTCLMLKQDYVLKMREYVEKCVSKGVYVEAQSKAQYVATRAFVRLRVDVLKFIRNSSTGVKFPTELVAGLEHMSVLSAALPHLYGVVKSHKEGNPMRPICSTVSWVARPIQKMLLFILKTAFADLLCKQNVSNIDEMAGQLHKMQQREGYVYVKFDVTDMYGSMNKVKIASVLHDLLVHPTVKANLPLSVGLVERLFHFSMDTSCLISFDGRVYRQIRGLPQGACDSGFLATLYLDTMLQLHYEELFTAHHVVRWFKYMDDILLYMPKKYVADFQETFERITELKLEVEFEEVLDAGVTPVPGIACAISFLDIQIFRMTDGQVLVSRYTKPTASKRIIHAYSSTLQTYKLNTLRGFVLKILKRTSNALLVLDLNNFYEQALYNGYPCTLLENMYNDMISREIENLKAGKGSISMCRVKIRERVNLLEAVLPDFPKGGPEVIDEIRKHHVPIAVDSRNVFPYRSVALSHVIRLGCSYGGMSLPVYSRVDNTGAFSRFFGNRALGRISGAVDADRRRFNVGFVWCTTCGIVFVVSGRMSLERLFESEINRSNSALYRHQESFGHRISPVVRTLRPIKGVDAAYLNTIYSAIFTSIGLSCSDPPLLSRVPYFIRGLLGYMQGYGDFSPTPRLMSPEIDLLNNNGLSAILQDVSAVDSVSDNDEEDLSHVFPDELEGHDVFEYFLATDGLSPGLENSVVLKERGETELDLLPSVSGGVLQDGCNVQPILEIGECCEPIPSSPCGQQRSPASAIISISSADTVEEEIVLEQFE